MKKYLVLSITSILLGIATVVFTGMIIVQMNHYSEKKQEIAETMNAETRLGNALEWLPEPFNWTSDDMVDKHHKLDYQANKYYQKGAKLGWVFLGIVLLYALINIAVYRKHAERWRIWGIALLGSAMAFLYLGLQTPSMEISAYKDNVELNIPINYDFDENMLTEWMGIGKVDEEVGVGVQGRVYFMYQNKSVLGAIHLLWTGGNQLVAALLFSFSVVFPILKILFSFALFLAPRWRHSLGAASAVSILGKWSMADVFVASFFLAIFSMTQMSVGADTSSAALIGLYFFLAFVVLSILSGYFIKKAIKQSIHPLEEQAPIDEVMDAIDN